MNWGIKLMFVFVGFVGLVLVMVYLTFQHDVDLVAEDYYDQEIKYQEEINRLKKASLLEDPLQIVFNRQENQLKIVFPHPEPSLVQGEILLFRPSDRKQDERYPVNPDVNGSQVIRVGGLSPGLWKIKIYWNYREDKYLEEKDLIL
jgi:hypothetical protein